MGSDFRARRGLRALAVMTATSLALIGTYAGTAAAATTNIQRAQQGAQWLANQIKSHGGVLQNFGKPDPVDTAYAVIGMRATGVDKPASDQAIAALKAAGVSHTDSRVNLGIAWLTRQQCANGLWEAYRSRPAVLPCVPANATTFTGPDTNRTAMAVQGLASWAKFPKQSSVLSALRNSQSSDAGFPFVAAKNQPSDPNSTALVIQALLAEKSAPSSGVWKKGTNTPYTALAAYQLGCTSPDFGSFMFPGSTAANVFATVQSVPAMAGKKLPVASSSASVVLGLTPC